MLCCRDDGWQRRGRLAVYGISKRASPPTDISALRRFVDPMDLNRYSIRVPVVSHGRTAANQLPSNDIQGPDSLQLCPTQTLCAWSNGVSPPSQLHFTGLIPNELARSSHRGPRRDRKRQVQKGYCLFAACIKPALFTQHYRTQSRSLPNLLPLHRDCLPYKLTASTHLLRSEQPSNHTRIDTTIVCGLAHQ